jgi:ABC-2 type transport system ATP-binding protein
LRALRRNATFSAIGCACYPSVAMITVDRLVKRYGQHLAVDDVSFRVGKGEVVGFLGPNGAGKSTTLRILAGFLGMSSGRVEVCGHDIAEEPLEAKKRIGYMPEAVPLYPEMRVGEYLAFRAELKGVPRADRKKAVGAAMEKANVAQRADALIGRLSKGFKQRVGLADALVANPPLLVLDEPTAGLDPNQIREVRDVIVDLGREHTIFLSTHILSEVEAACTRAILIHRGKLVAEGTIAELRRLRRSPGLDVVVRGDADAATKALEGVDGVRKVARVSHEGDVGVFRCRWSKKLSEDAIASATEAAVTALVSAGLHVREARPTGSSLEDVFAQLTLGTADEEGEER